jgi:hypothetical protein
MQPIEYPLPVESVPPKRLANFTLKLVRPGFGPAAELPTSSQRDGVTAVAVRQAVHATFRRQPPRRFGFGTRNRPHSLA